MNRNLWILCISSIFAVFSLISPPKVYKVSAATTLKNASTVNFEPNKAISTERVQSYIEAQAEADGINPAVADWIVGHESQYGQNLVGDDGQSLGYWMVSTIYHPEVAAQCSMNIECSTAWALNWIKAGHIEQWSTWKYRYKWYPKETPPTQIFQ